MKLYCQKCQKVFEVDHPSGEDLASCPHCQELQPFPESVTSPGSVIGDFLIQKFISRGGMGEVLLAQQISLDRPVALKVIQGKFANDRDYVDSLVREARAAAKISHPNVVQAYAVGQDDGLFYFAMEYIKGETCKQLLKREKVMDFNLAAKVICEIARALNAIWTEQRMVHHDIKPDNIMLDARGVAKLADLGLAQRSGTENTDGDEVLGTPQYISPEQLTGIPTDVRSDLYSLGATFFQFVTGRFPYVAETPAETAKLHVLGTLEPPKSVNPDVPDVLNNIIMKMMAKDPAERYQSPEPLIKALELFLSQRPVDAESAAIPKMKLFRKTGASASAGRGKTKAKPDAASVPAPQDGGAFDPVPVVPEDGKTIADSASEGEAAEVSEAPVKKHFSIHKLIRPMMTLVFIGILCVGGVFCWKFFGTAKKELPPVGRIASDAVRPDFQKQVGAFVMELYNTNAPEKTISDVLAFLNSPEGTPRNVAERKLLADLYVAFAQLDESHCFAPAREKAHAAYLADLKVRMQAQQKADAAAEAKAKVAAARAAAEAEEARAVAERLRQKEQQMHKRIAALQKELDRYCTGMLTGFYASLAGDNAALRTAIEAADRYLPSSIHSTKEEQAMLHRFQLWKKQLPVEAKVQKEFLWALKLIDHANGIIFTPDGHTPATLVAVTPERVRYRLRDEIRDVSWEQLPESARHQLVKVLSRRMKQDDVRFRLALSSRQFQLLHANEVPAGFWRDVFPDLIRVVRNLNGSAQPSEK